MNTKLSLILAGVGGAVLFAFGVACDVETHPDGMSDDDMRFAELPSLGDSGYELEPFGESGWEPELEPWDDDGVLEPAISISHAEELVDGGYAPETAGCMSIHKDQACNNLPYHYVTEFCVGDDLYESVKAACHPYAANPSQRVSCKAHCGTQTATCVTVQDVCDGRSSAKCDCGEKSVAGGWQIDPTLDPFGQ